MQPLPTCPVQHNQSVCPCLLDSWPWHCCTWLSRQLPCLNSLNPNLKELIEELRKQTCIRENIILPTFRFNKSLDRLSGEEKTKLNNLLHKSAIDTMRIAMLNLKKEEEYFLIQHCNKYQDTIQSIQNSTQRECLAHKIKKYT